MLLLRLKILDPLVQKFVIVEADRTFAGKPKPFTLDDHYDRFRPWHDKIVYERVHINPNLTNSQVKPPTTFDPDHPCWRIEYAQRNAIAKATEIYPAHTTVMVSDVDEIPRREAVEFALTVPENNYPVVLRQHVFCYSLKFMRNIMWNGTIVTTLANLREQTPQNLRGRRNELPAIDHGGWHLSYFTTPDNIAHKIENFSHQEYNLPQFKAKEHIAYCLESGEDLFDRDGPVMTPEQDQFPLYFRDNVNPEWWGV